MSGGLDAKAKMAPPLHSAPRKVLQEQQMSPEAINSYLSSLKNLDRYNRPFQITWALLEEKGIDPPIATIPQVVSALLQLKEISISQARNAYSALIHFPQFQRLKFSPLLSQLKKEWNTNVQKYASFWDANPILQAMADYHMTDLTDLASVRDRLIISFRLLMLHRGVDLQRTLRSISFAQGSPFILVKRKGWKNYKWEQVISLPQHESISPFHLLKKYVALTASHGHPGGPLLLSLKPPMYL